MLLSEKQNSCRGVDEALPRFQPGWAQTAGPSSKFRRMGIWNRRIPDGERSSGTASRLALGPAARLHLVSAPMSAAELMLALYEPDIAANTGAMMRTCACLGVDAAIIEPAGFAISDRRFRRSAMDYLEALSIAHHDSFERFEAWRATAERRLVLLTTKGESELWDFAFRPGDILMVGRESAGVPDTVAAVADARVRIKLRPPLRSLNVAIAAALATGEARRQLRHVNTPTSV